MHPDIHLRLHALRASDLRDRAPRRPAVRDRRPLRTRLGWTLVELGLRLVAAPPAPLRTARIA
ncbi:hypothetical protein EIZ62_20720 [Streptomyces ficellus]|uniref:Uncharacterized protein n=1 Tax=Streptomyces ficellus TaxID=1977088 RepID=A0A6I6F8V0_9ACTN|nr:hypothetical protein [Streptomyces ficellus]QGV80383.1 hypothetical protein EIZ62_20720 [Streptomyces ficellus]